MPKEGNTPDLSDQALVQEQQPGSGDQPGTAEGEPSPETGAQGQGTGQPSQEGTASHDTGQGESGEKAQTVEEIDEAIAELEKTDLDPALKEKLKKGFLRQRDYTLKTQKLSTDRETLDKLLAQLEELTAGEESDESADQGEADAELPADEKSQKAIEYIQGLIDRKVREALTPLQKKERVNGLVSEFKDLVTEHPDAKEHWETLLQMVLKDKRASNFADAYILLRHEDLVTQANEQGKAEGAGEAKEKSDAHVEPAGAPASREGTGQSEEDKVFDEISNAGGKKLFR